MSFLSILKTIGKDALIVGKVAAPVVTTFNPVAGGALSGLLGLVTTAEQLHATADDKTGPQKKQWVLDMVIKAGVPIIEGLMEQRGEKVNIDIDALSEAIDATVTLLNAVNKLHSSFSIEKIAAPAAA